jgi:hypothetical protein
VVGGRLKRGLKERLTLFVVPVAYTLLDDLQEKLRNLWKGKKIVK